MVLKLNFLYAFFPFLFNNKINLLQSIWLIQSMYWSYWQSTEFVRALEIFSYNHYQLNGIKTYILIVINRFQLNSIFIQFSQEHIICFFYFLSCFIFYVFVDSQTQIEPINQITVCWTTRKEHSLSSFFLLTLFFRDMTNAESLSII